MRRLKIIALLVIVGFVVVSGSLAGRWAKAVLAEFVTQPVRANVSDSNAPRSARNRPMAAKLSMAAALASGQLPEPLPVPAGDSDEAAEELAAKIAAKDEQSTAALLTALQMSGFSVRDSSGELYLKPTGASQGMAFDAFSVAAMSKLYGEGISVNFSRFSTTVANTLAGFKDVPLAKLLFDGIRTDSQSDKPQLRFWARLIAALGRRADRPYDLLTENVDPAVVALDTVQFSLIIKRLAGDGIALSRQPSSPNAIRYDRLAQPVLVEAVFRPSAQPRLLRVSEEPTGAQNIPCSMDEMTATLTDLGAVLESIGFGALADHVKEHGVEGFGKFAEAAGKINGLLMILKLVWLQSALTVDVSMDESELVRTQGTTPGALRHLTAKVSIDMGKWQELNCFRLMTAAATGIDLGNIPKDAGGVGVDWILVEGGDTRGLLGTVKDFWPILMGEQADTDAIVGLKPPKEDEDNNSYIAHRTANEDGIAKMDVEGTPQKKDLTNSKLSPVMKEMAIQVGIRWKNANTPGKLFGDFVDLLGSAGGVLLEDPSAPINVAVEMIYRCHCFKSPIFRFRVRDWEECNGGWTGNISYTATNQTVHNSSARDYQNTEATALTQRLSVQVHGNAGNQGDPDVMRGTFSGSAQASDFGQTHWTNGCSVTSDSKVSASGGGDTDVRITPRITAYDIRVNDVTIKSEATYHGTVHCDRVTPPPDTQSSGTLSLGIPEFNADVDPKEPGLLRGSKTFPNLLPGGETVVSWNLQQCQ